MRGGTDCFPAPSLSGLTGGGGVPRVEGAVLRRRRRSGARSPLSQRTKSRPGSWRCLSLETGGARWGKGRRLGAPGAASSMRQGSACLLRGAPLPLPQPFCSAAAMLGAVPRARAGSSASASGRWRGAEGSRGAVVTASAALTAGGAFCWAFLRLAFRGGDCVLSTVMSRSRSVVEPQNACGFFTCLPRSF